jgi:hypothetical protein
MMSYRNMMLAAITIARACSTASARFFNEVANDLEMGLLPVLRSPDPDGEVVAAIVSLLGGMDGAARADVLARVAVALNVKEARETSLPPAMPGMTSEAKPAEPAEPADPPEKPKGEAAPPEPQADDSPSRSVHVEDVASNVVPITSALDLPKLFDVEAADRDALIEKMCELQPGWQPPPRIRRSQLATMVSELLGKQMARAMSTSPRPPLPEKPPPEGTAPKPLPVLEPEASGHERMISVHRPPGISTDPADVRRAEELAQHLGRFFADPSYKAVIQSYYNEMMCDHACVREGDGGQVGACPWIRTEPGRTGCWDRWNDDTEEASA